MKQFMSMLLLTIVLVTIVFSHPAQAADLVNGAKLFNANCSACHMGGNNVIIANKTLKQEALEKYNLNSIAAIKNQVINGKNAMPAFRNRLTEAQVEDVAAYVLEQAQKGW